MSTDENHDAGAAEAQPTHERTATPTPGASPPLDAPRDQPKNDAGVSS